MVTRQELDIFVAGFSCKSFSGMNPNSSSSASLLHNPTSEQLEKSCSLRTYVGVRKLIKETTPKLVILENVENIANTDVVAKASDKNYMTNLEVVLGDLRSMGYAATAVPVSSVTFGIPQTRTRYFFMAIKKDSDPDKTVASLNRSTDVLEQFELGCTDALSYLLPHEHIQVEQLLGHKQQEAESREDSAVNTKWQASHMAMAEKMGVVWPLPVDDELASSEFFQTLTQREKELIIFTKLSNDRRNKGDRLVEFVDLSQSAGRTPCSAANVVPTLLPGTKLWSLSKNRMLTGMEHMCLQGLVFCEADRKFVGFSHNQLCDLAGNAFTGPAFMGVLIALLSQMNALSANVDDPIDGDIESLFECAGSTLK